MKDFKRKLKRKLLDKGGETLVESLVGLIIVVLAIGVLCGSIVTAAKINDRVKKMDTNFIAAIDTGNDASVTVKHEDGSSDQVTVKSHETGNGYYYYEP